MNDKVKPKAEHFVLVLQGARIAILKGQAEGLCYALDRGAMHLRAPLGWRKELEWRNELNGAKWVLRRRIQDSLGLYGWVDSWLAGEHGIPVKRMTEKRMKAYRLAWIDALIAEYEGK